LWDITATKTNNNNNNKNKPVGERYCKHPYCLSCVCPGKMRASEAGGAIWLLFDKRKATKRAKPFEVLIR